MIRFVSRFFSVWFHRVFVAVFPSRTNIFLFQGNEDDDDGEKEEVRVDCEWFWSTTIEEFLWVECLLYVRMCIHTKCNMRHIFAEWENGSTQ